MRILQILPFIDDLIGAVSKAVKATSQAMRKDSERGKRVSKGEWEEILTSYLAAMQVILRAILEGVLGAEIQDR